ncbi:alpha/beta hydrolase [Rhizomonospora bruguierae]|uniref:alpha/beta hydrolase n=1 Tax=Rhizomonospora bruguierae TaxID=1581705 RepID=UPI001BCAB2EA|nr:alpha/beta hydrolase [Micromonospora sp. NBRC 107566]
MRTWLARLLAASLLLTALRPVAAFAPAPVPAPLPGVAGWLADPSRPDPATTAPAEAARYLAGLSPAERASLVAGFPGVVGNLDGAPVALRYAANAAAGPQVLAYDPRGDGRRVQVVGDLATADRVAVLIPGVDTTAANFATGLGGVLRRAPQWQAEQVWGAAGDPGLAVVAWLGYDPPEGIGLAAVRSDRAVAGAEALLRFLAGLAAVRPSASVVLIGHSYGTLVLAHAAGRLPASVTDLVLLGSPGMDGADADALGHHAGRDARVWTGSAPGDWTRWLPDLRLLGLGHGTNPARTWFGGNRLDTDGVAGHDGYFVPGTPFMRELAAIVADPAAAAGPR